MSIETFDQRFKRLTSDMLMIDICRLLGIEIRQLMKIRSGTRVELSMAGLRRLCLEQGLDFSSFVRGYSDPWSSETTPTEVITSDEPIAVPVKAGKPLFRADGSRIPQEPPVLAAQKPVETVRSKLQVSFRPSKAAPAPTIPEKYDPTVATEDEVFFADEDGTPRPTLAARLREVVTSAFRSNPSQSSSTPPARIITTSGSSEERQTQEIEGLISEVSSLRHEIVTLTATVREALLLQR